MNPLLNSVAAFVFSYSDRLKALIGTTKRTKSVQKVHTELEKLCMIMHIIDDA
jgi:hypothetical protein